MKVAVWILGRPLPEGLAIGAGPRGRIEVRAPGWALPLPLRPRAQEPGAYDYEAQVPGPDWAVMDATIRFPKGGAARADSLLFLAHDGRGHYARWIDVRRGDRQARFRLPVRAGRFRDCEFLSAFWSVRPRWGAYDSAYFEFQPRQVRRLEFEASPAAWVLGSLGPAAKGLAYATFRAFPKDFRRHRLAAAGGSYRAGLPAGLYLAGGAYETKESVRAAAAGGPAVLALRPGERRRLDFRRGSAARLRIAPPAASAGPGGELWAIGVAPGERKSLSFFEVCYAPFAYLWEGRRWEPHGVAAPETLLFESRAGGEAPYEAPAGRFDAWLVELRYGPDPGLRVLDVVPGLLLPPGGSAELAFSAPRASRGASIAGVFRGFRVRGLGALRRAGTPGRLGRELLPQVDALALDGRYLGSAYGRAGEDDFAAVTTALATGEEHPLRAGFDGDRRFRLDGLPAGPCLVRAAALGRLLLERRLLLEPGKTARLEVSCV